MNYKSTFTWKFQTGLKLRSFFNCREVLKVFVCSHEHFILGVWTLVNWNWPLKFLQSFISFRVENSLQVKMCTHAISHRFENFTSINLTEVKYYPKWTQTQSEIKVMWTQLENTPHTKVSTLSTLAINIIPLQQDYIFG